MDDQQIVDLYWARAENAISETVHKYGRYSEYVSAESGIDAKFAVYETVGYASAYFIDNGILYSVSVGGFAEEDNIDLAEYLKGLIDTFE